MGHLWANMSRKVQETKVTTCTVLCVDWVVVFDYDFVYQRGCVKWSLKLFAPRLGCLGFACLGRWNRSFTPPMWETENAVTSTVCETQVSFVLLQPVSHTGLDPCLVRDIRLHFYMLLWFRQTEIYPSLIATSFHVCQSVVFKRTNSIPEVTHPHSMFCSFWIHISSHNKTVSLFLF